MRHTAAEERAMTAFNKNPQISAAILARVAAGASLPEAVDAVLGAGAYAKLAGDVYDALRAKK
jgi:hypothetical protein